jgi:hypothetical protein
VDDVRARILSLPDTSHRRMFGTDCFLVGGRMFLFFPGAESAAFKLPEAERSRLLALPGAGPFVMTGGSAFGTWGQAPLSSLGGGALLAFAKEAHEHVRSQPAARARRKNRLRQT